MMSTINSEHEANVVFLELNHGVTNAINSQVVQELSESIQAVKSNPNIHAVVLTSSNDKFFSIGLDIPALIDLDEQDFTVFYKSFNRLCLDLFALPKLTIAAITGHAVAGGCILALCCDYRFVAEGRNLMGLNEIKLGVPVPYPADCILRNLVGDRNARDIMYHGEFYPPEDAFQLGLVDRIPPEEQLRPTVIKTAETLGADSPTAFQLIKRNRVEPIITRVHAGLEEREQLFVERWYSDFTRGKLREAIEKF
ncbi:MAG: enoyl-CoA hydratase/isomerase family protein [Fidelibacterota bacterium]|nr:MAG: enoyl-CoA hydratase/isomerase family protein [Candidatus Neomarinimicrobiota bacterium]